MIVDDIADSESLFVASTRDAFLAGAYHVPVALGVTSPAGFVERAERDCLTVARTHIAQAVGPAARLVDAGYFAGHGLVALLADMERPKAAVILSTSSDSRQEQRVRETQTTAEITLIDRDGDQPDWSLEPMGAGRTLVTFTGGGFGLYDRETAFDVLDHASEALITGDFVLLTLEQPQDGASLEAAYLDYCHQIVISALSKIGRHEGFETRVFFDGLSHCLRFGAMAGPQACIAWNGTKCYPSLGTWIEVGAIAFTDVQCGPDLHCDFAVEDQWLSQDKSVALLLLRKT